MSESAENITKTRDQGTQCDFKSYAKYDYHSTQTIRTDRKINKLSSRSAHCLTHHNGSAQFPSSPLVKVDRPRSFAYLQRDLSNDSIKSNWERYPSSTSTFNINTDRISDSHSTSSPPIYRSKHNSGLSLIHVNQFNHYNQKRAVNVNVKEAPKPDFTNSASWRHLHSYRAKLKATAATSELLSGFAMIAMVELQVNGNSGAPQWLLVCFAVSTTILVSVHIFALMVATYLLPHIEAAAKLATEYALKESPHERMKNFIEISWVLSTILGLILFLLEIAILCWVKFWDVSMQAAAAATAIVVPVLVIFIGFALYFHWSMVVRRCFGATFCRRRKKPSGRDSPV